jgi:uncharacterized protein
MKGVQVRLSEHQRRQLEQIKRVLFNADRQDDSMLEPADVMELQSCWDEAISHAPDPKNPVRYLAERTGVDKSKIYRLRDVRNRCAHPHQEGFPHTGEFNEALAVAREIRRRLSSSW